MEIQGWMFNVLLVGAGLVSSWVLMRSKVQQLSKELDRTRDDRARLEALVGALGIRLDGVREMLHDQDKRLSRALDLPTAEDKFVLKKELELQLKTFSLALTHTDESISAIDRKLASMLNIIGK